MPVIGTGQHLYLIKVNDDGTREILRGGPENGGLGSLGEDIIDVREMGYVDLSEFDISTHGNKTFINDLNSDFSVALIGQHSLTEQDFVFA